jgi:hypothetical protein
MTGVSPGRDAAIQNSAPGLPVPAGVRGVESSMKRGRLLTLVVVLAFAAFLLWSTLGSQRVECAVTVQYGGSERTGTASAVSREDALREAQTAACGPLTASMNDRIACSRTPPATTRCRSL